ncbi:MAG: hypothetical protein ACJ0KI_01985 [Dehalococcoidia bacterium]
MEVILEPSTRLAALQSGEADLIEANMNYRPNLRSSQSEHGCLLARRELHALDDLHRLLGRRHVVLPERC